MDHFGYLEMEKKISKSLTCPTILKRARGQEKKMLAELLGILPQTKRTDPWLNQQHTVNRKLNNRKPPARLVISKHIISFMMPISMA